MLELVIAKHPGVIWVCGRLRASADLLGEAGRFAAPALRDGPPVFFPPFSRAPIGATSG